MLTILPPASPPVDTNLPKRELPSSRSAKADDAEAASATAKRRTKKNANDDGRDDFNVMLGQMLGKTEQTTPVNVDSSTDAIGSTDLTAENVGAPVAEMPLQTTVAAPASDVTVGVDSKPLLPTLEVNAETGDIAESQTQNLVDASLETMTATLAPQLDSNITQTLDDVRPSEMLATETKPGQVPILPEPTVVPKAEIAQATVQRTAIVPPTTVPVSADSAKVAEAAEVTPVETTNVAIKPPLVEESRKPSDSEETPVTDSPESKGKSVASSAAVPVAAISNTEELASSIKSVDASTGVQARSASNARDTQQPVAAEQSSFEVLEQFWSQHTNSSSSVDQEQSSAAITAKASKAVAQASSQAAPMPIHEPLTNGSMATMDLSTAISTEQRQPLSSQVSNAILDQLARQPDRNQDSITIKLDPPELGEMTIELSKTNGGLAVRVTAREAVTMDMLFSRGDEIESHLRDQNLDLKSLEFLAPGMTSGGGSQGQQQSRTMDSETSAAGLQRAGRRATAGSSPTSRSSPVVADSNHALTFRA